MNIKIGDTAQFSKTISESDVYTFAGVTGDFNPSHVDEEYAKTTRFGKRIDHGMLTASLISTVIAGKLPGPGIIYLGQDIKFMAPVFIGDTITAVVTVETIDNKRGIVKLETQCRNQRKEIVLEGTAMVMVPK